MTILTVFKRKHAKQQPLERLRMVGPTLSELDHWSMPSCSSPTQGDNDYARLAFGPSLPQRLRKRGGYLFRSLLCYHKT